MKNTTIILIAAFILCAASVQESISLRSKSQIVITTKTSTDARIQIEKNFLNGYRVVGMVSQGVSYVADVRSSPDITVKSDILIVMEK
jgi:uncharacterized protein YcfL